MRDLGETDCIVVGSDESIDGNSEDEVEECFFYDENEVMCLGSKEDMMTMSSTSYNNCFGNEAASTTAG